MVFSCAAAGRRGTDPVVCLQARLEVHRFGITGYGKGKERVLEQERAIMLGAKVRAANTGDAGRYL
jgi:hypothetical protein